MAGWENHREAKILSAKVNISYPFFFSVTSRFFSVPLNSRNFHIGSIALLTLAMADLTCMPSVNFESIVSPECY